MFRRFFISFSLAFLLGVAAHPTAVAQAQKPALYLCPMDKDVQSDKPGKCPVCGMKLLKRDLSRTKTAEYRLAQKISFPKNVTDGYDIAVTLVPVPKPDSSGTHTVEVRVTDAKTKKRVTDADCWFHIVYPDGTNLMPHLEPTGDRCTARIALAQKGAYTFMAHVNTDEKNVTRVVTARLY